MRNIWLYHVNPKSPQGYTYGWNVNNPKAMLIMRDREWPASQMRKQVAVGDLLYVYVKNMKGKPDGVYIAGTITKVDEDAGTFIWKPDLRRSGRLVIAPIVTDKVQALFGRGFGGAMQRLPADRTRKWLALVDAVAEVMDGVPVVRLNAKAKRKVPLDPFASRENGILGEKFILRFLRKRYSKSEGYDVRHVAITNQSSDHDIAVFKGKKTVQLVEVKTRVGSPDDPVIISENELRCRKEHQGSHSIFIVYLGARKAVVSVLEIQARDAFTLSPRQHWLRPVL